MKTQAKDWEKNLSKYVSDKGLECRIYTQNSKNGNSIKIGQKI